MWGFHSSFKSLQASALEHTRWGLPSRPSFLSSSLSYFSFSSGVECKSFAPWRNTKTDMFVKEHEQHDTYAEWHKWLGICGPRFKTFWLLKKYVSTSQLLQCLFTESSGFCNPYLKVAIVTIWTLKNTCKMSCCESSNLLQLFLSWSLLH